MEDRIPSDNVIGVYIHCGLCLDELHSGSPDADEPLSPRDYQHIQVGWTKAGLQVWCVRHEVNVVHIDFEGCKHPANTGRKLLPNEPKPEK